jgi:hypothetical protein
MQDSKDIKFASDYARDAEDEGGTISSATESDSPNADQSDPDGWQQYRRWISKAPAPRGRRAGVDPSLYTWKGYRNWTEQVKRNWSDKE